jgi:phage shock protein C
MDVTDRLYRSRDDRMLAGVAGGVADLLGFDPSLVRIVWLLAAFLTGGIALVVYVVMAIVVPERPADLGPSTASAPGAAPGDATPSSAYGASSVPGGHRRDPADRARAGFVIGAVLVLVGILFLIRELIPALDLGLWWPIAAIGLGVLLIVMAVAPRRSG